MITNLVASTVRDLLEVASNESFFEESEAKRGSHAKQVLGKEYPSALIEYVQGISAVQFANDMQTLLSVLATGSVMAFGRAAHKHRTLHACAQALKEIWVNKYEATNTHLGRMLATSDLGQGKSRTGRFIDREAQQFIELVLHEDSPYVQIAEQLEDTVKTLATLQETYGGLPVTRVERKLLGGSRLFVKGKLHDSSWRAKVQTFFNALKTPTN